MLAHLCCGAAFPADVASNAILDYNALYRCMSGCVMEYLTAAFVGAGIGFIGFWIWLNIHHFWLRRPALATVATPEALERRFRNVFAVMTEGRRQSLIRSYMDKHGCDRTTAMRYAVEDHEADTMRW